VLIVSGVGGVLGLISLTVPPEAGIHPHAFVPTWLWVGLLLGGIMVAQFLAFHDVRKERDNALTDLATTFDSLRYRFQMAEFGGTPLTMQFVDERDPETGYDFQFLFTNGGTEVIEYGVESAQIVLSDGSSQLAEAEFTSTGGLVLPGTTTVFTYHWIPASIDPLLAGRGSYTVIYGHPSGPKFRTHHVFVFTWITSAGTGPRVRWLTIGKITHEPVAAGAKT
jgi:hypothetical protein